MAKIFGNILVPYDDSAHSKRALDKALNMAELTGAALTLAHVISYDETGKNHSTARGFNSPS